MAPRFEMPRATNASEQKRTVNELVCDEETGFFKTRRNPILMAALAASMQACGVHVGLPMPDGSMVEFQTASSSGSSEATPSNPQETQLSANPERADRDVYHTHRVERDRTRVFLEGNHPDPTQLPHLQGTQLLDVSSDVPQEFQRANIPVAQRDQATQNLYRAATFNPDTQGVSISYRMASARMSGGAYNPENTGGMRLNVQLVSHDQVMQAVPENSAGVQIMRGDIPEDDLDTRGQDEGIRGMGATEQDAAAAAMTQLINHLVDLHPTHVQHGVFSTPGSGTRYELTYSQQGAVIYLEKIHTTFEHLSSGIVRATIDGGAQHDGHWRMAIPAGQQETVANQVITQRLTIAP